MWSVVTSYLGFSFGANETYWQLFSKKTNDLGWFEDKKWFLHIIFSVLYISFFLTIDLNKGLDWDDNVQKVRKWEQIIPLREYHKIHKIVRSYLIGWKKKRSNFTIPSISVINHFILWGSFKTAFVQSTYAYKRLC